MATEIIKLIEEFASKNAQLEKMNTQLGQKGKDGHEFRQKLAQSRESCKVTIFFVFFVALSARRNIDLSFSFSLPFMYVYACALATRRCPSASHSS